MCRLFSIRNCAASQNVGHSWHDTVRVMRTQMTRMLLSNGLRYLLAVALALPVAAAASSRAQASSLDEAAEHYRPDLVEGIGQALMGVRTLQACVAAGDLQGARRAWISARAGWERFEVFTSGFVPELDRKVDAWPNATTGFHAIEAKLFGANRTDVEADTGALVADLTSLQTKAREIPLTPQGLMNGAAQLAFEVGENKSDGGESRLSGTSLDDMRNNALGIEVAYNVVFSVTVGEADRELAAAISTKIKELKTLLDVSRLNNVDAVALRQVTEELVVTLQNAAPKIGLDRPTMEASP